MEIYTLYTTKNEAFSPKCHKLSMVKLQEETIVTIKAEAEKTRDVISNRITQDVTELRHEIDHVKTIVSKVVDKVGISE